MEITYVIIAHNEESTVSNAIRSVESQKGIKDYEILVVDDGSTDNTAGVVKTLQKDKKSIKLLSLSSNKGRGYARQKGIDLALGKHIAFVDSDIILPPHWAETCLEDLKQHDIVGGIAIPDGDVSFVYKKFELVPKKATHTTAITGSNCMAKKEVFSKLGFKNVSDGEDVDFSWRAEKLGLKLYSISTLIVAHEENKSFVQSLEWLFQSGIGSTRLLIKFRNIRKPDIAFFIFMLSLISSISFPIFVPLATAYLILTSYLHLSAKFLQDKPPNFIGAVLVNTVLLLSFFMGRLIGFFKLSSYYAK
ncbi:MAG: glycosyltransferase family A protein [Patescibacteria group bacterium]|jgi:glycosyltransferase involved in cell wall biosynthesis